MVRNIRGSTFETGAFKKKAIETAAKKKTTSTKIADDTGTSSA